MSRKGPGAKIKVGRSWDGKAHGDRGNVSMDVDAVRLLKSQDLGYVRTMRQVAVKGAKRLEEQVVLTKGFDNLDEDDEDDEFEDEDDEDDMPLPSKSKSQVPRKIVFVDDEEERTTVLSRGLGDSQDSDEPEKRKPGNDDEAEERAAQKEKNLQRLKRQLQHAQRKVKALTQAERELEVQKAKMAKTATSGGTTRRGKKIMVRARKR